MTSSTTLTAIDVFSGCGGLTLGLKNGGFSVLGAVELSALAVETYCKNHPEVHVWQEDIRKLKPNDILKTLNLNKGELTLLAGCPPCQGFSRLTRLNGKREINDPRNDLVLDYLEFAKRLRPKVVMLENVPGLEHDTRFTRLIEGLQNLGYDVNHRILDAANFGVPQRRRRLVLIGSRVIDPVFAKASDAKRTVASAIGNLPKSGESGDELHDMPERRSTRVTELIRQIPKDGGSRMDLGKSRQLACHKRCDGFKDIYGRMAWNAVAPTITSGCFNPSKGRFLHPEENRCITLREAAFLQSFPRKLLLFTQEG